MEIADFGLVLFSVFDQQKVIGQNALNCPENRPVKNPRIINNFSQLSVENYLIFNIKVIDMLIDDLHLLFTNEIDTVFKIQHAFMNVGQVDFQLGHHHQFFFCAFLLCHQVYLFKLEFKCGFIVQQNFQLLLQRFSFFCVFVLGPLVVDFAGHSCQN